jgi:beta-lactamase class A
VRCAFDFSLNDDVRMPSASTIKVPILIEALRQARESVVDLSSVYSVPRESCCDGSGVLTHLHDGVSLTLKDLLMLMIGLLLPEGVLANKTGQVDGMVHDCGVISTPEFRYSIAVFTKDAPVPGEAKVAIGGISKAVYDAIAAGKTC